MVAANAGILPSAQLIQPGLIQQRYIQPQVAIQQVAQPILAKQVEEYDPNPQYSYAYDVQDSLTGDSKSQQETRSGDTVQGQYSLIDADGLRRVVDYTADPVNGFNAVVSREPLVAKTIVAQPALVKSVVAQPYVAQQALLAQPSLLRSSLVGQQLIGGQQILGGPQLLRSQLGVAHL